MPNPLDAFDLAAPDAPAHLLARVEALNAERAAAYQRFRDTLSPEQVQQLHVLLALAGDRERLSGARLALLTVSGAGRGNTETLREQLKAERMARHEATQRAAAAEAKLARHARGPKNDFKPSAKDRYVPDAARPLDVPERAFMASEATPAPLPPRNAALLASRKPEWDYKPVEPRPMRRGEVITPDPFGVEVVARQVEAFVTRHGRCMKPDVSAALAPEVRGLLSQAYRHLHASRRVYVNGWELSTWPHGEGR